MNHGQGSRSAIEEHSFPLIQLNLHTLDGPLVTCNGFVSAPGCTDDIFSSDHSPVFATFEVGVTSQLSSKTGAVTLAKITDELCLIPLCGPNSVVIPFVW